MPADVRKRYFTVSEANALLPRIRVRVLRMMQLRACLRGGDDQTPAATPPGTPWMADPVLAAWNARDSERNDAMTRALEAALRNEQTALSTLGVTVKDLGRGLIDLGAVPRLLGKICVRSIG